MDEYAFDVLLFSDENRGLGDVLRIEPQAMIGPYRVDFVVRFRFDEKQKIEIVVECDGHDFHERTKEQASSDKARDRTLQRLGYRVFRFTGSDIHADARGCARDVIAAVMEWFTARASEAAYG